MMTREKRLTWKRTKRNANSARKRWLRNRNMTPQWRPGREKLSSLRARIATIAAMPLRGVRTRLDDPKPTPQRKGFFARIIHRVIKH